MEKPTIGIIGGNGRMGALMARLFTESGHEVSIFDAKNGPVDWEKAAANDVVLLSVPIPAFSEVVENLGPHTRPDGAVIDVSSVKAEPVRAMLAVCRGEVIGSHPLFGPNPPSLDGQIVFVCPARAGRWLAWFRDVLENSGLRTVEIEPEHHDRLMSRVQVLRHLFLFCFGRSLMRLDFDLRNHADLSGPWFSELVGLLSNQLRQRPDLYADLALHNPAASEVLDEFRNAADEVAESFASGDRSRIVRLIDEVSSYLAPAVRVTLP